MRTRSGGPWGTGLALAGAGLAAYGAAYVAPVPGDEIPRPLLIASEHLQLWVWGAAWVAAGAWSVWRGLRPPQVRRDALPLILVTHLWGSLYMVSWLYLGLIRDEWTRDWRGWMLFGSLATLLIVWSKLVNPPTQLRARR